jgi:hypothetical protein
VLKVAGSRRIDEPASDAWGRHWGLDRYNDPGVLIWTQGGSHMQYDPTVEVKAQLPESVEAHTWAATAAARQATRRRRAGAAGRAGARGAGLGPGGHRAPDRRSREGNDDAIRPFRIEMPQRELADLWAAAAGAPPAARVERAGAASRIHFGTPQASVP